MKATTHSNTPMRSDGFTLLEMMVVIGIIAILSAIAAPQYRGYVLEAKAAALLTQIHEIGMVYQHVQMTHPIDSSNVKTYASPSFGKAPPTFGDMDNLYVLPGDIEMSSQIVNHTGYFNYATTEYLPVLFIRANTDAGIDLLNAMDHITAGKHSFISPNLLMIALTQPTESNRIGSSPGPATPAIQAVAVAPTRAPILAPPVAPMPVPTTAPTPVPGKVPNLVPQLAPRVTPDPVTNTPPSTAPATLPSQNPTVVAAAKPDAPVLSSGTLPPLQLPMPANIKPIVAVVENCHTAHPGWPKGWFNHPENHGDRHCHR
jgi:prepilin-type N-terminal cleavage/methylation domain-containing protein